MSKFHSLRIAQVTKETRDAIVVVFDVPSVLKETFRFKHGQHLTLRTNIEGSEVRRSYSICSGVADERLRIAVKRVAGGLFSNWAQEHLVPGTTLEVMPPSGNFHSPLAKDHSKHYIAFAAGSGITPVLSIVKTTLESEPLSRFTLVYGNRASSTVLFKEELEDLKDRYLERLNLVFVLSREKLDVDLFNGRIDAAKVDALFKSWIDPNELDLAFVCGPYGMMESVRGALLTHGFDASRIKVELFATSANEARPPQRHHGVAGANECEVTIMQDGRTSFFTMAKDDESILDAGLSQGIELPYSCKAGVCSTCRAKRVSGEVDMDANFALEDYELARGFVLTCQSFPVSDQIVLDYDQET
ncbi:MAG: 1,2-phenylacetyl-CoA epoxidase subunit PaaE [Burkholderiaceae bacterium]|jgi:ring-1,2-phenylacetyl-CoA epoxidase subunit PaaE